MEGVLRNQVRLLPHNEEWDKEFLHVKREIEEVWDDIVVDIQHFGSTSIKNIYAKPILDVAVVVKSFHVMRPEDLVNLGYEYIGLDFPSTNRHLFVLRDENDFSLRHIHCYEPNDEDFIACTGFRDYLNAHPDEAKEYSDLKIELEKKYANDRYAFGKGKHDFIQAIYKKIGI